MPGNYLNIDAELPSFTGRESEKDMVMAMMSYLTQLTEQLRFTLMNLDKSNFNRKALDEISTGSAGSIAEQLQTLASQLNQTNGRIAALGSRMQTAEGAISTLQSDVGAVQEDMGSLQESVETLAGAVQVDENTGDITIGDGQVQVDLSGGTVNINGEEADIGSILQELSGHGDSIDALAGAVQVDGITGDITVGGTDVRVDIDGDVYINGAPA